MGISPEEIRRTIDRYLLQFPDERENLGRITEAIARGTALASRKEFRGHLTAGAVVVDPLWRVLHVKHRALDRWLMPGGHLEPRDRSLMGGALRELHEETGITAAALGPVPEFEVAPLDIDTHAIPGSRDKEEPGHWHFDFRHVFRTCSPSVELQEAEVSGYRWLPLEKVAERRLARKLHDLRGSGG
jgi:8-oxo-dGTP pyrophosphatase MutT (NUDIX family)